MATLSVHGLTVFIGSRSLLCDLKFEAGAGEIVVLAGPNGVGKSTLLRSLAGIGTPTRGSVSIDGLPLGALSPHERARRITYIADDQAISDAITVYEFIAQSRYPHHRWHEWSASEADRTAIEGALHAVGMSDLAARDIGTLSSGERQRAWLGLALAQEASVLLLDEPTSHLDIKASHEMLLLFRALASQGRTIIAAFHDLNEAARIANRIVLLKDGIQYAYGSPTEILIPSTLEAVYGIPLDVFVAPAGFSYIAPRLS